MEVWIVTKESYTEVGGIFQVLGVFSTKSKADNFISASCFEMSSHLTVARAILDVGTIYGICGTEWNA